MRFSAENHLSIKNRQELSLVASGLDDFDGGLIHSDAVEGNVLPSLVIYGANAAGKSTIVSALRWLRSAVLFSHSRSQPGDPVPTSPFLLDRRSKRQSSKYDLDFVLHGIRYHYGVEASSEEFEREWLYSFPKGRRALLFERVGSDIDPGRGLRGQIKVMMTLTRPNSLFISTAAQNGHEQLSEIAGYFKSIDVMGASSTPPGSDDFENDAIDSRVLRLLEGIGTGITGYVIERKKRSEARRKFEQKLQALFRTEIDQTIEFPDRDEVAQLKFTHRGHGGKGFPIDFQLESDGTQRLFDLARRAFPILDTGSVMVVDELDSSLHTLACEAILGLFSNKTSNPKGAQLVATTHDTNLLRSKFLRRDQVWFTEKNDLGATQMYPLTDIHTRKGDNLERGYLQGRYGAIPFSGLLSDFLPRSEKL